MEPNRSPDPPSVKRALRLRKVIRLAFLAAMLTAGLMLRVRGTKRGIVQETDPVWRLHHKHYLSAIVLPLLPHSEHRQSP